MKSSELLFFSAFHDLRWDLTRSVDETLLDHREMVVDVQDEEERADTYRGVAVEKGNDSWLLRLRMESDGSLMVALCLGWSSAFSKSCGCCMARCSSLISLIREPLTIAPTPIQNI